VEVLSSGDLFNRPFSRARIARCISVGVRKEQVGAGHAIPSGGARDALLEVGERERRELMADIEKVNAKWEEAARRAYGASMGWAASCLPVVRAGGAFGRKSFREAGAPGVREGEMCGRGTLRAGGAQPPS